MILQRQPYPYRSLTIMLHNKRIFSGLIVICKQIFIISSMFISFNAFALASNNKCSLLSESECLKSKDCILDKYSAEEIKSHPLLNQARPYYCRDPKNSCEIDFQQTGFSIEESKNQCEKTQNCIYQRAGCYCPENHLCICGGGSPSGCKEKNRKLGQ